MFASALLRLLCARRIAPAGLVALGLTAVLACNPESSRIIGADIGGSGGSAAGGRAGTGGGTATGGGGGAGGAGGGALGGAGGGAGGSNVDAGVDAASGGAGDSMPIDAAAGGAGGTGGSAGMGGAAGSGGATPVDVLYGFDDFQANAGPLDDVATGAGFAFPWYLPDNDKVRPGYEIATTTPLAFPGLRSTPAYLSGGRGYRSAGRAFQTSPGGAYRTLLDSSFMVGDAGKELWVSVLLRKDVDTDTPVYLALHRSPTVEWDGDMNNPSTVAFGYLGSEVSNDVMTGKRYWSLRVHGEVTRSPIEVVVGQTVLLVVHVQFGAPATVRLYVSPTALGGAAPATPTLEMVAAGTKPLSFRSLKLTPGQDPQNGSVDELRFGSSYAAVTPKP